VLAAVFYQGCKSEMTAEVQDQAAVEQGQ
jgi:hypothetical protein